MGKVVIRRVAPQQSLARVELNNGDQVTISVRDGQVEVTKMKWAGMLPGSTLWKSRSSAEIVEKFSDEPKLPQRLIEAVIDKVIDCRSAAEVAARLSAKPDDVLKQYLAALEKTGDKVVIRDVSELPYPKDLIKSALWHYLNRINRADQNAVQALEVAYVSLSHFQPLTPEQRDAVLMMQNVDASHVEIEGADLYSALISRWHAEGAELLDELRSMSYGGEVAD
jgi:hypothetical protein